MKLLMRGPPLLKVSTSRGDFEENSMLEREPTAALLATPRSSIEVGPLIYSGFFFVTAREDGFRMLTNRSIMTIEEPSGKERLGGGQSSEYRESDDELIVAADGKPPRSGTNVTACPDLICISAVHVVSASTSALNARTGRIPSVPSSGAPR